MKGRIKLDVSEECAHFEKMHSRHYYVLSRVFLFCFLDQNSKNEATNHNHIPLEKTIREDF